MPKYKQFPEYKNHEKIIALDDPPSGLKGFIAIHSTMRGPALGGTRIFPYKNPNQALKDALKLSSAMTNKCVMAKLRFGGGKGVIIADPKSKNLSSLLRAYAKKISELKGEFYTGEDVGLNETDVQYMLKFSPYFIGKSGQAGDPSPFAAQSAFLCARTAWKSLRGSSNLSGLTVAIKGVGKTGSALAKLFAAAGSKVTVADINPHAVRTLQKSHPAISAISIKALPDLRADIYAPCALGSDITLKNYKRIKARLVVGTANNQLENPEVARHLHNNHILHVPDYIANAGGLIDVADELLPGGYNEQRVLKSIAKLEAVLERILALSKKAGINPDQAAEQEAQRVLAPKQPRVKAAESVIA